MLSPLPASPDKPPCLCRGVRRDVIGVYLGADSLPDRVTQAEGCDKGMEARGGVSHVVAARAGDVGPCGGSSGGLLAPCCHPVLSVASQPTQTPLQGPERVQARTRVPKEVLEGPQQRRGKAQGVWVTRGAGTQQGGILGRPGLGCLLLP